MKTSNIIVVGTAWGDEGKGKIVDYLSKFSGIIVRSAGGNNAGHTLIVDNKKIIFKLIPCGIFHKHTICLLGQGMVIDLNVLISEINMLKQMNINLQNRLFISDKAHIILPHYIAADIKLDKIQKIGTLNKGIGPCYTSKVARCGFRIHELLESKSYIQSKLSEYMCYDDVDKITQDLLTFKEHIIDYITDVPFLLHTHTNRNVVFEGAQGTLLDIDHGTYPYVTSSNCSAGGACVGAGIGPNKVTCVVGISKAYMTRVGNGPFPTKLSGELCEQLRSKGGEFGSVSGRPRDVGWLDLPLLHYAKYINGLTHLVITKLDVLSFLDKIKICTGYENICNVDIHNGTIDNAVPIHKLSTIIPKYITLPGWKSDITKIRNFVDLPQNAKDYINFISKAVDLPIKYISVGPEKEAVINQPHIQILS